LIFALLFFMLGRFNFRGLRWNFSY
jgi:hypothetical protein